MTLLGFRLSVFLNPESIEEAFRQSGRRASRFGALVLVVLEQSRRMQSAASESRLLPPGKRHSRSVSNNGSYELKPCSHLNKRRWMSRRHTIPAQRSIARMNNLFRAGALTGRQHC
jgi:hypothetical protein